MFDGDYHKFDWGNFVRISVSAPKKFLPGAIGSICGMIKVTTEILADKYGTTIGEWIYTVEYVGGFDHEVPERFLDKLDDQAE